MSDVDLWRLRDVLTGMQKVERHDEWVRMQRYLDAVKKCAACHVVEPILSGFPVGRSGIDEFLYACAEARWNFARKARQDLRRFQDMDRHLPVKEFGRLEHQRFRDVRKTILARHYLNISRDNGKGMDIVRYAISKKRCHKSLRRLMKDAGKTVRRIRPVFLMSPLSVAQYIEPGLAGFDLLVMDEASQFKPEDALGCIARARQLVVVGDEKQLPPPSFFNRLVNDEADAEDEDSEEDVVAVSVNDMESILSLCAARAFQQEMLAWHYRSRDPSLIQISNQEFYENKLALPVPPWQKHDDYRLKFRHVDGVCSPAQGGSGRARTNRIEAEVIVDAACEHARRFPELFLGIVAFSKSQTDMINEILEQKMRDDPFLEAFYREREQGSESLFVKNIENVQGDERDVILISVCYGPKIAGGKAGQPEFWPDRQRWWRTAA